MRKDPHFLFLRRIVQKKERKQFHHSHGISYSTLRQEFREHLGPFAVDIKKFGLHSIKSGGASNPALRRVDSELLDRHVGWKSSKTKHRYVKYRANDILKVTEAIGL